MKGKASEDRMKTMCDNLFWRLRDWVFRSYYKEYLTISQIIDKTYKYAPKSIRSNKAAFISVVESLWAINNDYTFYDGDYMEEDFNDSINYYF